MTRSDASAQPAFGTASRPYIGGQAVLEGVMMRAPRSFAIVVRRRDGSLHVRERGMADERVGWRRLPMLRGIASLVESLKLGSEALRFSAEQMEKDLDAADAAAKPSKASGIASALGMTVFALATNDGEDADQSGRKPTQEQEKKTSYAMLLMLVMVIGFFIALPQAFAAGINRWFHLGLDVQSPAFQAITGAMKLAIVIGYLTMIRRVPDIRRVFQYHGAEHKTISTYEANEPLTVANARAKTTLHPRCGTTFLVMVALVSILVFTAIGGFLPKIHTGKALLDNVVFFAEKLPFLPLIAAVTFEIQRVFARYCTTGPLRVLLWPGFLCQKITTIEPTDDQLEVALASLRVTLFREKGEDGAGRSGDSSALAASRTSDVRYANFDALMKAPRLRRAA